MFTNASEKIGYTLDGCRLDFPASTSSNGSEDEQKFRRILVDTGDDDEPEQVVGVTAAGDAAACAGSRLWVVGRVARLPTATRSPR
jgi:hypothetical protein